MTARRVLVAVVIVAIAIGLWKIVDALLLVFLGALIAVFLRGLARRVSDHTPLSVGWSLAAVSIGLAALFGIACVLLGPRFAVEFSQLTQTLPASVEQLKQSVRALPGGEQVIASLQGPDGKMQLGGDLFSRFTGMASRTLSILTNIILVLFAAIFFAADPDLYKRGVVALVPKDKSERAGEALDATGRALWKWLMGKFIAMLFVATYVSIGLMLVGVPLPLALGLISGLSDFVPFIGPTVAGIPGVLLAFTISPTKALWAALVYFSAQQIEGNIITPIIQKEKVSLPPVLILLAIVAAGLLFGILGVIVATPLVVVLMTLVKMLYVEDVLGKEVDVPGAKEKSKR